MAKNLRRSISRLLGRVTGFSTPFFGLSWTPRESKKTISSSESCANAFMLGTILITNINAVSEQPRKVDKIQQLWSSVQGLCKKLNIDAPGIPGKKKVIDGDEAFNLTMPIVQEIRQILDEEHNGRIGTAFWFGVISMLGGQFCQNPALTSKAQPLIKEVGSLANEFKIPNTIVASYIKSLNSKDPLLVQRSVMSFIESVSEKLA